MNKLIKELALKAGAHLRGGYIEQPNGDYKYSKTTRIGITDLDVEKFTKLIIEECTNLTLDYKNTQHYEGWLDYRDEIKKHFGIE